MSHVQLDRVALAAQNGSVLVPEITATVARETVGLVGTNGCGKTTLLRAVAGEVTPLSGAINLDGVPALMRQGAYPGGTSLAQALGAQTQLEILERFERGSPAEADHNAIDWTYPARLEETLASIGLEAIDLKRSIDGLSGGERNRLKLAELLLRQPDILLLDEPTNDLDAEGRALIYSLLESWDGPVLVATHDRELLNQADRIIELSSVGSFIVSGGWSAFEEAREAERARANRALELARAEETSARRARQANIEKQQNHARKGKETAKRRDRSRLEINAKKERAQATSARNRTIGIDRLGHASQARANAERDVARTTPIRIELPSCQLAPGHIVLRAVGLCGEAGGRSLFGPLDLKVTGPERILICGPNGSGKSTLLRYLAGSNAPTVGIVDLEPARVAFLDQHLGLLHPEETALRAMQRLNQSLGANAARAALARFGFRSSWSDRSVASLSGGEKVRLALACLFSGKVTPHALVLDEPTNHLDFKSIEMLEEALAAYEEAIICATHDRRFAGALRAERILNLGNT